MDKDEIRMQVEAFHTANKVNPTEFANNMRERILALWGELGNITVQCPNCLKNQSCRTVKTIKCFNCGKSYSVVSTKKMRGYDRPTRIVWCNPAKLHILHEIESLELFGGKREVLF